MKIKPTQKVKKIFKNHQEALELMSIKNHHKFIELLGLEDFHDESKVTIKIKCGEEIDGYYQSIVTVKIYS